MNSWIERIYHEPRINYMRSVWKRETGEPFPCIEMFGDSLDTQIASLEAELLEKAGIVVGALSDKELEAYADWFDNGGADGLPEDIGENNPWLNG